MDREKAIDWIYGERLLQPIGAKPPSEKRTLSEEEQRRGLPLDVMSGFPGKVVNRLFSVGLSLESARSIVGDGPPGTGSRTRPASWTG